MVIIEFGAAERQNLDVNSLFITFKGEHFQENVAKIKGFWNRICHGKPKWEWEVPYSCCNEILELYKGEDIRYLNNPPKAKLVDNDDILNGLDFNGYNLYDYQLDGVKYGVNHYNWLLLDEQGLGKTLQAIVLARYLKEHNNLKHCLIVCGVNSLKWNWQREIEKFCKNEKGIVLGTRKNSKGKMVSITVEETKKQIESCPEEFFWIINIEKMRASTGEIKKGTSIINYLNDQIMQKNLGMIIVDEVHKCIDYNSIIKTDKGDLKIGDLVENKIKCNCLSYNTRNNTLEWKPIINYYKNKTNNPVVNIYLDNENKLTCTNNHKIFTINRGWVEAKDLIPGDEVIVID